MIRRPFPYFKWTNWLSSDQWVTASKSKFCSTTSSRVNLTSLIICWILLAGNNQTKPPSPQQMVPLLTILANWAKRVQDHLNILMKILRRLRWDKPDKPLTSPIVATMIWKMIFKLIIMKILLNAEVWWLLDKTWLAPKTTSLKVLVLYVCWDTIIILRVSRSRRDQVILVYHRVVQTQTIFTSSEEKS